MHEIHDKLDKRINSRATGAEPTHWNTNKDGQAGRCSQQRQRGHGLFPEPQQPHVGQKTGQPDRGANTRRQPCQQHDKAGDYDPRGLYKHQLQSIKDQGSRIKDHTNTIGDEIKHHFPIGNTKRK